MRNKALAAAALTAALAFGCRKSAEQPQAAEPSPTLSAPATMVTNPLTKSTAVYTNEMQAAYLRDQAAALGITRLGPTTRSGSESETPPPGVSYAEGLERTKELEQALANQRRQIDRNKPKTVDLPGNTPMLLQTPADGGGGTPAPAAPQIAP